MSIDRSAHIPVFVQIAGQLSRRIHTGEWETGRVLPSTRALGQQLGVSFHTVRKAYQLLHEQGLVEAKHGLGFVVLERHPLTKAERMEQGAAVVQEALADLRALGLSDQEVDYIIQEQIEFFDRTPSSRKIIFVAEFLEFAVAASFQIESIIQEPVSPATVADLSFHQDADLAFVDMHLVAAVTAGLENTEVHGVLLHLGPDGLEAIARLLSHETLGLVTRHPASINPLVRKIKAETGFSGQVVATALDEGGSRLQSFVRQSDLLAYLPGCRRRLRSLLDDRGRHVELLPVISPLSLAAIRAQTQR